MKATTRTIVVLSALAVIIPVAACALSRADSAADGCAGLRWQPASASTPRYLFLLDLSDNSPSTADRIVTALGPSVRDAIDQEASLRAIIDPGIGRSLIDVPCLDGSAALSTSRNNIRREQADRSAAVETIGNLVRTAIRAAPVQPYGTPTRVLSRAAELADVNTSAVIWSNFLGVTEPGNDCMNVDGLTATPDIAAAVIDRCAAAGQLQPIRTHELELIGVGSGAVTPPQSLLASLLAGEAERQIVSRRLER